MESEGVQLAMDWTAPKFRVQLSRLASDLKNGINNKKLIVTIILKY